MSRADQTPYEMFRAAFRLSSINAAYEDHIAGGLAAGVDGITPERFESDKDHHLSTIYRKCNDGSYSFSPYRQVLIPRGPSRPPRQIAVPTVRDRVMLHLLKELLHSLFPQAVEQDLPNTYAAHLKKALQSVDGADTLYIRTDLSNFYPSINRDILFNRLQCTTRSSYILTLVSRALLSPVVPPDYKRSERNKYRSERGVPQGLAISNILADIYAMELDEKLRSEAIFYRRYVDDIVILIPADKKGQLTRTVSSAVARLDLEENEAKRSVGSVDTKFQYLGYTFDGDDISVRRSTVQRHIDTLAGVVTRLRRGGYIQSDPRTKKRVFLDDLNEKITGAIADDRRYGWIFYFLELNDLELLHRFDAIVDEFFGRLELFNGTPPSGLKRHVRAYYEAKHSPESGYIKDYNSYSLSDKEDFLDDRGLREPNMSPDDIKKRFEREKKKRLRDLMQDVGRLS